MRLSVIVGDADFTSAPGKSQVTLDGVIQKHCLIADEEKGMVRRFKLSKIGTLMRGKKGLVTEDVFGVVVIKVLS